MTARLGPRQSMGPRNNASPQARRHDRQRAEAQGFALLAQERTARRAKTDRLRKLREERDADAAKG